jgi:hypothetical protein
LHHSAFPDEAPEKARLQGEAMPPFRSRKLLQMGTFPPPKLSARSVTFSISHHHSGRPSPLLGKLGETIMNLPLFLVSLALFVIIAPIVWNIAKEFFGAALII